MKKLTFIRSTFKWLAIFLLSGSVILWRGELPKKIKSNAFFIEALNGFWSAAHTSKDKSKRGGPVRCLAQDEEGIIVQYTGTTMESAGTVKFDPSYIK